MQVKVYNLTQYEHGADDVLVMGTDGLWDVLSNQEVAEAVTTFLGNCDPDDLHRSATFFSLTTPEHWCFLFSSLHYYIWILKRLNYNLGHEPISANNVIK